MEPQTLTPEFLEKHRNNTRKYMNQYNLTPTTSKNPDETLQRIRSKFGFEPRKRPSSESEIRSSQNPEDSIQKFIEEMRKKYLNEPPILPIPSSSNPHQSKPLELKNLKSPPKNLPSPIKNEVVQIQEPNLEIQKIDFSVTIEANKPNDSPLTAEDLVSEPSFNKPLLKPPRNRLDTSQSFEREELNKSLNESSMSFRRSEAEHIINLTIADIVKKKLGRQPKPLESFDEFLKVHKRFSPLKKTPNMEKIFEEDFCLMELEEKERAILRELEVVKAEISILKEVRNEGVL